ncbi:MAG TPA: hypothetical protein VNX67_01745 [Solirubrobacteraceae bacterium]|nr:hypothetical protein [Solirubrobacteraceae bacterium]
MRAALLHPLTAWRQHEQASSPPAAPDIAVRRNRDAGGPVDEACYPCSCGYFFIAPVSTSVRCPHCGSTQAW